MSRCFSYPPPGYELDINRRTALIDFYKKGKKAKKERKDKKRDKKEKDRDGRDRKVEEKKHRHKRRHKDKRRDDDEKGQEQRKTNDKPAEQPEKSSLTEDHTYPVGSQNLCDSPDSTLNSNKRQKLCSPPGDWQGLGSANEIRLPLQMPKKDLEAQSSCNPDIILAHSRERNSPDCTWAGDEMMAPCSTSDATEFHNSTSGMESGSSGVFSGSAAPTSRGSTLSDVLKFKELFDNWAPCSPPSECTGVEDQQWLFSRKQDSHVAGKERRVVSYNNWSHEYSTPWTRICYLPEADIYALPFTVPY